MPKLVQGYQAAGRPLRRDSTFSVLMRNFLESGKGIAYLIGLSCLLQSMPKQTSVAELPKVRASSLLLRAGSI